MSYFCLERLEDRLKLIDGSKITASESRLLLVDLASCFVDVGRQLEEVMANVESIQTKRPNNDSDLMRSGLHWFGERVLPTLISTAILGSILWVSAVNGYISVGG